MDVRLKMREWESETADVAVIARVDSIISLRALHQERAHGAIEVRRVCGRMWCRAAGAPTGAKGQADGGSRTRNLGFTKAVLCH